MKQEFEVSVEELLRTLKRRGIPLASEMGAFITLEVCEQIIDRPAHVSTHEVAISEIGEVLCGALPGEASEADAVRSLLQLLGDLLVCAAPGVPSMLLELVERGPSEGLHTLDRLRDDLEACLLPLNRGATRRVLARLLREARKAGPSSRAVAQPAAAAGPTAADIDAQFDALLGSVSPPGADVSEAAATKPRAAPVRRPEPAAAAPAPAALRFDMTPVTKPIGGPQPSTADVSLADELEPDQQHAHDEGVDSSPPEAEPEALGLRTSEAEDEPPARPAEARRRRASHGSGLDTDGLIEAPPRKSATGAWVFGACVVAAVGLTATYMALGRQGTRSALGLLPEPNTAEMPTDTRAAHDRPQRRVGELRVNSTPGRAQVLLLIGPGPALADDLPLGVAQEFVAVADGFAPARAVVPADAVWDEVDGKPRYEIAIQAARASADGTKAGLGRTLLPQDVGTPQARTGSVRIVTTPKAAKVYQLIGFTPDVRVENLPLDRPYDLLVYLDGHPPVARHVEVSDFAALEGKLVAQIELTLAAAKGR